MPSFRFPSRPPREYQFTCAGVDTEKVKRTLEKVCNAMPFDDRAAMRSFWLTHGGPEIIIEDVFVLKSSRDDGVHPSLGEHTLGVKFRFAGRAMNNMTDLEAETLIAHEFAHGVYHRDEVEKELNPEDSAVIEQFEAEALAVASEGEEAVLKVFRGQLKRRTDWIEPAIHKRILTWNQQYDDRMLRDWLAYYLNHNAPPPRSNPEPAQEPFPPLHDIEDEDEDPGDATAPPPLKKHLLAALLLALLAVLIIGLLLTGVF